MQFDTKIAVLLREDLLAWQRLNVTAFTVSGIATLPEVVGEAYEDADGRRYRPMIKQPILIFQASREQLREAYARAVGSDETQLSIYTEDLFSTPHDEANRAAVRGVRSEDLNLVGLAVRGRKKVMEKLTKGLVLHP